MPSARDSNVIDWNREEEKGDGWMGTGKGETGMGKMEHCIPPPLRIPYLKLKADAYGYIGQKDACDTPSKIIEAFKATRVF